MFIDTHCHINLMVKKDFDTPITEQELEAARTIIDQANQAGVTKIINVGTSLIESINSIKLAQKYDNIYAAIGIHPNDLNKNWKSELKELETYLKYKEEHKIIGIGEAGIDFHYPEYNIETQSSAFRKQIELALKYDLALVVHSRDGYELTLKILEEYIKDGLRGTIHCFSYDKDFAEQVIKWGFVIGIDGPITYPKNQQLRDIVKETSLNSIILETDAPYLPPQIIRGKTNQPLHIKTIAEYIALLRNEPLSTIANKTTNTANRIFKILN